MTASPASGPLPPDLSEMKRKIDADGQGAENQRDEARLDIDRHRMPRQQIDADEQVERPPEEIHDGSGRAFAARLGERRRKDFAAQSAGQMRDAIAEESPGKERRDIVHAITSEMGDARSRRSSNPHREPQFDPHSHRRASNVLEAMRVIGKKLACCGSQTLSTA